jgi:hypothetical protein
MTRLHDGLRSGEVWLDGSRRWADPESYLLDKSTWAGRRTEYWAGVERPSAAKARLDRLGTQLDAELATCADLLEAGADICVGWLHREAEDVRGRPSAVLKSRGPQCRHRCLLGILRERADGHAEPEHGSSEVIGRGT